MEAKVQMAKVWPLHPGVSGYTVEGRAISLPVLMPGWMVYEDALKAQEAGDVQIMAGLRPEDLKEPKMGPGRPRKNPLSKEMKAKGKNKGAKDPASASSEKGHTYDRRDLIAKRADD